MSAAALWQISVRAAESREEEIVARLEEKLGASPVVYRDADTGVLSISAYLSKLAQPPRILQRNLASALSVKPSAISVQRLRRENWATSWRRHFKPIQISGKLLIKPSWSRRRARAGQRVVILDPGLSFGTGQHATTSFCLHQLAQCCDKEAGQSFLDIGTGSVILAIAAAKLDYAPVEAFDFDADAVTVAGRNARRNNVLDKISLRQADLTRLPKRPRQRFDVICANLTYDLLASEAEKLAGLLRPDGRLIVAGILDAQFPIVTRSLQRFGLTLRESELNSIWRSGQFAFPSRVQRGRRAK